MPAANQSRDDAVDRLLGAFRRHGYDGASLAELSKATGLGRSSLYHHFPGGKEDMAIAVLDRVDAWMAENVIAPLQGSEPPGERLQRMIAAMDRFYVGGYESCVLGNLVLGGTRARFQDRLRSAFESWIQALTTLGRDAGIAEAAARRNAEDAVVQIQGALVVAGGLDDPAPFRRVLERMPGLLLAN